MWPRIHIMLLLVLDNTGDQSDVMSPLIELGSLLANMKEGKLKRKQNVQVSTILKFNHRRAFVDPNLS